MTSRTKLTQGPVTQYGAIYDRIDKHTHVARYASGSISEWHGAFAAKLLKPLHTTDSFGRFGAGRDLLISPGRVYVTRYTHEDADGTTEVRYQVLNTSGIRVDVPADQAKEYLRSERDSAGKLIFVNDDPAYRAAAKRRAQLMAY